MPELSAADVEAFTGGRLVDDDGSGPPGETTRMLQAALAVARREVGWPVSPVVDVSLVLDGPGARVLHLPTRRLTELAAVSEDGTVLDVERLEWSESGWVRKLSGGCWTARYRGLSVEMTHGYTEDEAADWRQAILAMVDQMSLVPVGVGGRSAADLTRKKIDDVEHQWSDGKYAALADSVLWSVTHIIDQYRLTPVVGS